MDRRPRPLPRRRARRVLMRDVPISDSPALRVSIATVETDGGRLWVRLECERGKITDSVQWQSAVREALTPRADDGLTVRGSGRGHPVSHTSVHAGGGADHLSAEFVFERATVGSHLLIGWPRL